jgi:hypothetical protein
MFLRNFVIYLRNYTTPNAVPWIRWLNRQPLIVEASGSRPYQSIRDLWWTKRHWDFFSLSSSVFPSQRLSAVHLEFNILHGR